MIFEYNKLGQAQKRPMTVKENVSLFLFISKVFLSKLGIFFFFLSLNILPIFFENSQKRNIFNHFQSTATYGISESSNTLASLPKDKPTEIGSGVSTSFHSVDSNLGNQSCFGGELGGVRNCVAFHAQHAQHANFSSESSEFYQASSKNAQDLGKYKKATLLEKNFCYNFIQKYCIIATIVTLFLNPQQTKYFGGLAVVLKQAGFFSKYGKSEKTVYVISWIFIGVFFYNSYRLSKTLLI